MSEYIRPADDDAEVLVIGGLLNNPDQVGQYSFLSPDDFSHPDNAFAFQAIQDVYQANHQIDQMSVAHRMAQLSGAYTPGEPFTILAAATVAAWTGRLDTAATIVRGKSQQWRLMQSLRSAAQMVTRQDANITAEHLMRNLLGILEDDRSNNRVRPYHVALSDYVDTLESYINHPELMLRLGFGELDNALGGVRGGDLIYVAARPSMGKSSFVKPIGRRVAARFKHQGKGGVLHISLEVPMADIVESHIANRFAPALDTRYMRAGLRLEDGESDEATYAQILKVAAQEDNDTHGHYFLVDHPSTTTADVERYILQTPDVGMVIIDQFNLLKDRVKGEEFERLSEISHRLKAIAMRHNLPLFCATQIKRDVEDRSNRRPTMADLRGTGDQEQDADIVLGIYRPEYYSKPDFENPADNEAYGRFAELLILKNRKGKAGGDMVPLYWNMESAQYTDWPHERYQLSDVLSCVRAKEQGQPAKRKGK